MSINKDDIKEILNLLDALPYDEIHLETAGFKLSLSRKVGVLLSNAARVDAAECGAPEDVAKPAAGVPAGAPFDGTAAITAPLPGTLYRAPKPGAEAYVKVGDRIGNDTVVCIIEVMKLMNSIEAGVRGEVVEICGGDGELVDFGQVLFRVKTA